MGADQHIDWMGTAASVLDWWQDAGVDTLVDEQPRDWLAAPVPQQPLAPAAAEPVVAPAAAMSDDLATFLAWRIAADAPEAAWRGVSIAATGPADAKVMVLVDCPDKEDGAESLLMTGMVGRLFDRMLAAIGLSRDAVHLAAVCARRPLAGRMPGDVEQRLSDISRHHIGLVAPQRVLLMGNAASRAILGMDMPASRGSLHQFNHKGGETGVVASYHPRFLLEKPAAKAEAWKDLQLLIQGMES